MVTPITYSTELAAPADEAAIRRLLRDNPIPGQMDISYEREPDYFLGCPVMGHTCQTLVARELASGQVVGLATRALRPLFVNGQAEVVGYIGQLRVDRAHQAHGLVAQGFRLLRQLHADGANTGYITTIIEGNAVAEGVLVQKARRLFPVYRPVCRLFTLALIVRRPRWPWPRSQAASLELRPAASVDLQDVVAFLQEQGRHKQFFPVYTADDLTGPATRDLRLDDVAVACRRGRIAGVLGLWDQSTYKQSVVRSYRADLRRLKPLYNLGAYLLGAQPLTAIGQPIHFAYASLACVQDDDPAIFQPLLAWVYNRAAERRFAFLMLGLAEGDPLLAVARRRLHIAYTSTLYTVCWREDAAWHDRLDGRPPYVEIATL